MSSCTSPTTPSLLYSLLSLTVVENAVVAQVPVILSSAQVGTSPLTTISRTRYSSAQTAPDAVQAASKTQESPVSVSVCTPRSSKPLSSQPSMVPGRPSPQ